MDKGLKKLFREIVPQIVNFPSGPRWRWFNGIHRLNAFTVSVVNIKRSATFFGKHMSTIVSKKKKTLNAPAWAFLYIIRFQWKCGRKASSWEKWFPNKVLFNTEDFFKYFRGNIFMEVNINGTWKERLCQEIRQSKTTLENSKHSKINATSSDEPIDVRSFFI